MTNLRDVFHQTSVSSPDYLRDIFAQRTLNSRSQGGSYYLEDVFDLIPKLTAANWVKSNHHPDRPGKDGSIIRTYRSNVGGYFGMLPLSKVPSNQPIFGFDPKKTGFGSGAIHSDAERPYYGYSYAIVAHNKDGSSFLLTVFPGPNMSPHEVTHQHLVHGTQYTKEQLKQLGIKWVKLVHAQ